LKVFIAEDEHYILAKLEALFNKTNDPGIQLTTATTFDKALEVLSTSKFDCEIIDLTLKDHFRKSEQTHNGLELLKFCSNAIVLTGEANQDIKKLCRGPKYRAKLVFSKGDNLKGVHSVVRQIRANLAKDRMSSLLRSKDTVTSSSLRSSLIQSASLIFSKNIYITGETGVGKTTFAKLLHEASNPNKPLINIDISSLPENMLESTLFGHMKGAFTGAEKDKKGLLELANGGTLFLDEIANLPSHLMDKLLKAIDEKEFYKLGGEKPIKSKFNLISASSTDIREKRSVKKDFTRRICGSVLEIPPLRERVEDIPGLIHAIKEDLNQVEFSEEVIKSISKLPFENNFSDLYDIVERLCSIPAIPVVEIQHFISILEEPYRGSIRPNEKMKKPNQQYELLNSNLVSLVEKVGLVEALGVVKNEIKEYFLWAEENNKVAACRKLKISRQSFYR